MTGIRPPLDLVLDTLRLDTRPAMRARFNANSCIAATKVVVEVARTFGYRARPVEVEVAAYNATAWKMIQDADGGPIANEDVLEGSKIVAIEAGDRGADSSSWPGAHLVAVVDGEWLVDLSLDQVARFDHDLPLEPIAEQLPADAWAQFNDGEWIGFEDDDTGVRLTYRRAPEATPYKTAPDWAKPERTGDLAEVTCRLVVARANGGAARIEHRIIEDSSVVE